MKLFELKITKEGITISRDSEMCLTGRQKYILLLTGISCYASCKVILAFLALMQ